MKCAEVQNALVGYLDKETTFAEGQAIQQHLAACPACQAQLAGLAAARRRASGWLHAAAANAEPAPQAWERLQTRLVGERLPEAHPSPRSLLEQAAGAVATAEPGSRPAPTPRASGTARGAGRSQTHILTGVKTMPKRIWIPTLMAVLAVVVVAIFAANHATPVSAQQVLDRAYALQSAPAAPGIHHERVEVYINVEALPGDQAGTRTIQDSYLDLQSGIFRQVILDAASGRVLSAFGYDGTYTYSSQEGARPEPGAALPVYRVPQSKDKVADLRASGAYNDNAAEQTFEYFRSAPQVELQTETWSDGRLVYMLTSQQPVKILSGGQVQTPSGLTSMVFDARTYQLLESRSQVQVDGQDVVIVSNRYAVNDTLPAGTSVAWDFSDLQGITLVDDPNAAFGYLLPEKVPPQEMANLQGLVLAHTPEGFVQQVSAPAGQPGGQPLAYIATYTNPAGDFFTVQTYNGPAALPPAAFNDETYTTASGLVLAFSQRLTKPGGVQVTSAIITAPDGARYSLTSSLPRAQVKEWAEDLVKTVG